MRYSRRSFLVAAAAAATTGTLYKSLEIAGEGIRGGESVLGGTLRHNSDVIGIDPDLAFKIGEEIDGNANFKRLITAGSVSGLTYLWTKALNQGRALLHGGRVASGFVMAYKSADIAEKLYIRADDEQVSSALQNEYALTKDQAAKIQFIARDVLVRNTSSFNILMPHILASAVTPMAARSLDDWDDPNI